MNASQEKRPVYIAIDLKSYYASVECVERGQNPLTFNLLVADESRSDKTIVLAVSPSLKAIGVPSRPRLFEAKQAIQLYEAQHKTKVDYTIAKPQMALYEKVSAQIYSIYLKYVATCDIHVYSIDEVFIEATHYIGGIILRLSIKSLYHRFHALSGLSPSIQNSPCHGLWDGSGKGDPQTFRLGDCGSVHL